MNKAPKAARKRRVSLNLPTSESGAWSVLPGASLDLTQKIVLGLIDGHGLHDRTKRFNAMMKALRGDEPTAGNPKDNDYPYLRWMAARMLERQTRASVWGAQPKRIVRPIPSVERLARAAVFYFDFLKGGNRDHDPYFSVELAERRERCASYLKSAAAKLVAEWPDKGQPLMGVIQRGPDESVYAEASALAQIREIVVPLGVPFNTARLPTE